MTDLLGGHGGKIEDFKAGTMRQGGSNKVLDVYGPCGIKEFLRTTFRLTYTILADSFRVHELLFESDPINKDEAYIREVGSRDLQVGPNGAWKDISCDNHCRVTAVPIRHSVPCLGYVIKEEDTVSIPQSVIAALQSHHKPGAGRYTELITELRNGKAIDLPDRQLGPIPREKGRQVVILGDTCDSDQVLAHVDPPVSLVLHESTNAYLPTYGNAADTLDSVRERAISRGHSTPEMAGEFARKCDSQMLILTHFSSRYSGADIKGAVKIMHCFERLASLAASATQESVEALFATPNPRNNKIQCRGLEPADKLTFDGEVRAAWDGMTVEIPKTGIMLPNHSEAEDR